jgi:hypothetical protein
LGINQVYTNGLKNLYPIGYKFLCGRLTPVFFKRSNEVVARLDAVDWGKLERESRELAEADENEGREADVPAFVKREFENQSQLSRTQLRAARGRRTEVKDRRRWNVHGLNLTFKMQEGLCPHLGAEIAPSLLNVDRTKDSGLYASGQGFWVFTPVNMLSGGQYNPFSNEESVQAYRKECGERTGRDLSGVSELFLKVDLVRTHIKGIVKNHMGDGTWEGMTPLLIM